MNLVVTQLTITYGKTYKSVILLFDISLSVHPRLHFEERDLQPVQRTSHIFITGPAGQQTIKIISLQLYVAVYVLR